MGGSGAGLGVGKGKKGQGHGFLPVLRPDTSLVETVSSVVSPPGGHMPPGVTLP